MARLFSQIRAKQYEWLDTAAERAAKLSRATNSFHALRLVDTVLTAGIPEVEKQQSIVEKCDAEKVKVDTYRRYSGIQQQLTSLRLSVWVRERDGEFVGLPISDIEQPEGYFIGDVYPPDGRERPFPLGVVAGTDRPVD
jgi:hypothetical protein